MPAPDTARAAFARWHARLAENAFDADPHLASLLRLHGYTDAEPALRSFGAAVSGRLDTLARETNKDAHLPQLRRWSPEGRRIEQIVFHPGYHEMGRIAYGTGLFGRYATPGAEFETLALAYLYSQNGEAGHGCPFACTAGMIKILQDAPDAPPDWLPRLYDPDYDTHIHAAQWLTEVQGGSDVGANALVARKEADGWRLYGEKWFCSVVDAQLALVTARPEGAGAGTGGLMAFVVPREKDGAPNGFAIRRLKDKLGTRSMASAELDFEGAWAQPVGDFKKVVEVVLNTSRLYNAVNAAGFLQRAWREADGYARERTAFGRPILEFPIIRRVVAGLFVEACAARATTFLLAAMADQLATGRAADGDAAAWRMLVNCNKIWTATTCPAGVRSAIEVLGGNGAIEEFGVLPRLLRDSIVLEAWEGGHGVLCAQILRDAQKLRLHEALFALLERIDPTVALDRVRARWARVVDGPDGAHHIRDLVEELRPIAQAAALAPEAADPRLAAAREHLLCTMRRDYDPLDDDGGPARLDRILG
jgi:acyl-CoA dehydrogenase